MFTIVIENSFEPLYCTEKLINALLCGTVPIYRGCSAATSLFDSNGIITFETIDELDDILRHHVHSDGFMSRADALRNNAMEARKYSRWENIMLRQYPFLLD